MTVTWPQRSSRVSNHCTSVSCISWTESRVSCLPLFAPTCNTTYTTMSSQLVSTLAWEKVVVENSIPERSSHGVSVVGETLVIFGGENVPRTPFDNQVHALDLSSPKPRSWTVLQPSGGEAPEPRVAHAQCTLGDNIYISGGRQSITMEEAPLNDLYAFNVKSLVWENLTGTSTGTPPCPRSFHRMVSAGRKLYIFGGCAKVGRLADLYSYDVETKVWEELPAFEKISGRGGPGFLPSSDGKSLFVVGGFSGKEMNDVFRYDIEQKLWEEVYPQENPSIRPFSVSCGAILEGRLTFFGGEVGESTKGHEGAGAFSADCQTFDGVTGKMYPSTVLEDHVHKPCPRGWTSAAGWGDDKLVVFGGLTGNDDAPMRLNDVWVLKPVE